jgi:DNA-binding transcriptional regulator YhcF (GntR family)
MNTALQIEPSSKTPLYKQLVEQIRHAIRKGDLRPGEQLPSMNILSAQSGISKETVKKAYGILSARGLLIAKQGKGFYVASPEVNGRPSVLVIFDKLSIYKQILYNSFQETLGERAEITVLMHNQNLDLMRYYLDTYLDQFDYYLVSPHFALDPDSQAEANRLLARIPNRKLILVDRLPEGYAGQFGAVYQDFENDVCEGLRQGLDKLRTMDRLNVLILPTSLYGPLMQTGIRNFCDENRIPVCFMSTPPAVVRPRETYLVINSQLDWGLTELARSIHSQGLEIGQDVHIISYNDIELNEVVLNGLSTVSTDFSQMGRVAAQMILNRKFEKVHCDFRLLRRNTF